MRLVVIVPDVVLLAILVVVCCCRKCCLWCSDTRCCEEIAANYVWLKPLCLHFRETVPGAMFLTDCLIYLDVLIGGLLRKPGQDKVSGRWSGAFEASDGRAALFITTELQTRLLRTTTQEQLFLFYRWLRFKHYLLQRFGSVWTVTWQIQSVLS